jgi:tetratricopeptide (TPR) repeat protein
MSGHRAPRVRRGRFLAIACLAAFAAAGCGESTEERVAEARKLLEEKQYDPSMEILRDVLEDDGEHAQANFLLGRAYIAKGDLNAAHWPLRRAAGSEELAVEAGVVLARTLAQTGNFEDAEAAATKVLEREPANSEALGIRAQARLSVSRFDDALADIAEKLVLTPDDPKLHFVQSQALMSAKRFDDACKALERAEQLFKDAGDLPSAAQSCANRGAVRERGDGNLKRAKAEVARCLELYPTQLAVLNAVSGLANAEGQPEHALEPLRRSVAAAPESIENRLALAQQLFVAGKTEDAVKEARGAVDDFGSLQAWITLSELQIRINDLEGAEASLQQAASLAADPQPYLFRRADVLVQRGDLDGAEKLSAELADPAFQSFIQGRVQLRRGNAAAALASFEKGLERWPNNSTVRAEAGMAAQQVGEMERALGHYREATRVDAASTHAGLAGATIAYALGRFGEAYALASTHVRTHPYEGPDAYRIAIRSAYEAGMTQQVEVLLQALEARGERGLAAAERARNAGAAGGAAAVVATIERAKLDLADPRSEAGLRALVEAQLAQQERERALASVDAALRRDAARPSLHDLRGRVLLTLDRTDEAKAEFERAIAADAGYGPAHAGLAMVMVRAGDREGALKALDAAAAAKTPDAESSYQAAQILLSDGRTADARKRLEEITRRLPDHAQAANDLAWILAEQKTDLDEAKRLAELAVRESASADTIDTLAWVQIQRGEIDDAKATLDKGLAAHPKHPTLLYRLGLARRAGGDREGALAAFREALQAGAFPQAEATQAEIAGLESTKGDQR